MSMFNLMGGGNPGTWLETAERAVSALERIATAAEQPPTRKTANHPGLDPEFTSEFHLHVSAGCALVFTRPVTGPAAWCEDHNIEVALLKAKACCCSPGPGCGMCAEGKHKYCTVVAP